jgi:hypothetical protein
LQFLDQVSFPIAAFQLLPESDILAHAQLSFSLLVPTCSLKAGHWRLNLSQLLGVAKVLSACLVPQAGCFKLLLGALKFINLVVSDSLNSSEVPVSKGSWCLIRALLKIGARDINCVLQDSH